MTELEEANAVIKGLESAIHLIKIQVIDWEKKYWRERWERSSNMMKDADHRLGIAEAISRGEHND